MGTSWQPDSSVAPRFLLGFAGTTLPDELRALLAQGLAGVAIFRRNFTSLEGLRALTHELRRAAGGPVLIAMDAEPGGPFSLPEPFTQWPAADELGALDDAPLVEQMAGALARELRAVGANLDFAPMLDLHTNPVSPVTTKRSFGPDPHKVARLGVAFVQQMSAEGVLCCAKHFPGHGDAQMDPHEDLPIFEGTAQRLDSRELVPFAAAINAGVQTIMTAHILLPKIDPERPASLSRKMLSETLRERMEFPGAILADDLGMGAIARRHGAGDAAVQTLRAGSDIAMLCHDWSLVRPALEAVQRARHDGRLSENEWRASHERIEWLRAAAESASRETPALDVVGCAEHCSLAEEIRARIANRPKGDQGSQPQLGH